MDSESNLTPFPRFITTEEASKLTGIPKSTLVTQRSRGGGPPYYTVPNSNRVRYEVNELNQWMKSGGSRTSTSDDQVITGDSPRSIDCKLLQSRTEEADA